MKRSLKVGFVLFCAGILCLGQTDGPSPSGTQQAGHQAKTRDDLAPATPAVPPPPVQSPSVTEPAPAAAAQPSELLPPVRKSASEGKPTAPAAEPDAAGARKRYIIGPLDVLIIKVWNNLNLSAPYDVGSDGMISMPLIGEVKADGLTREQLKVLLKQRLSEFLNSPEVDVQVAKINSKRYFIYGGVLRTGEFPLIQDTTVMDALSIVGGFKDFANTKKIYVQRGVQKFNFNYKDVSKGKNLEQNILLESGDRIFVPE